MEPIFGSKTFQGTYENRTRDLLHFLMTVNWLAPMTAGFSPEASIIPLDQSPEHNLPFGENININLILENVPWPIQCEGSITSAVDKLYISLLKCSIKQTL